MSNYFDHLLLLWLEVRVFAVEAKRLMNQNGIEALYHYILAFMFVEVRIYTLTVFGRPFVKRFVLCYRAVVCPVLSVCPVCNVCVLRPNGWIDQDKTWHRDRPRPRPYCVRWNPAPPRKGAQQPPPTFQPMSIVAKLSPISATAELSWDYVARSLQCGSCWSVYCSSAHC